MKVPILGVLAFLLTHINAYAQESGTQNGAVQAAILAFCSYSPGGETDRSKIVRSFNNLEGSVITIKGHAKHRGRCTIDFGVDIGQRFWSVSALYAAGPPRATACEPSRAESLTSFSSLTCETTVPQPNTDRYPKGFSSVNSHFMLILY